MNLALFWRAHSTDRPPKQPTNPSKPGPGAYKAPLLQCITAYYSASYYRLLPAHLQQPLLLRLCRLPLLAQVGDDALARLLLPLRGRPAGPRKAFPPLEKAHSALRCRLQAAVPTPCPSVAQACRSRLQLVGPLP